MLITWCISGTTQWKNFIPISYCRATQELLNGGRIMRIGPSEPKRTTSCVRPFFKCLQIACTKTVHHGAHRYLQIMGPEGEECRRVAGLCLES